MSKLVADATDEVMANDAMRIGCFERTGMLMTKAPSKEYDSKIRPQGFTKEIVIDPKYLADEGEIEFVSESNAVDNEEIECGWCAEDMEINEGDDDISEKDIVVEEELSEEETLEESQELGEQAPPLEDEIVTTRGRVVTVPARFRD
jgi:hypothetical protein